MPNFVFVFLIVSVFVFLIISVFIGEKDTFPSWKKTIMIGPSYQASVPSGTTNYDDRFHKNFPFSIASNGVFILQIIHYFQPFKLIIFSPPYENEDKQLWDPTRLAEEVKTYSLFQCYFVSWVYASTE